MFGSKAREILLLLTYNLVFFSTSFLFRLNFFWSIIGFLVIPSSFIAYRFSGSVKKALLFSFFVGGLVSVPIDYTAQVSGAWLILESIFPFRILGRVTVEAVLWGFFSVFYAVLFYEHFIDQEVSKKIWPSHMNYLASLSIVSTGIFVATLFISPSLIEVPNFYAMFGSIVFGVPIVLEVFEFPDQMKRITRAGAYFFIVTSLYEIAGLKLGWWIFPGSGFTGWVKLFGVTFPIEEFLFYLVIFEMAVISYYNYFEYGFDAGAEI